MPIRIAVPFGTGPVHLTEEDGGNSQFMLGVYDKVQTPGKRKTLSPRYVDLRSRGRE